MMVRRIAAEEFIQRVRHTPVIDVRAPAEFARGLAHGINTLLADEALRRRMGQNGRRRVEERFSWRSVAETTLALYRSVLRAGSSTARTGGG